MILRKYIHAVMAMLAAFGASSVDAAAQGYTAQATLDSTLLVQGGKSRLVVEFTGPLASNAHIEIVDTMWHDVEITPAEADEDTDLGNDRTTMRRIFIVQGFDSGLYTLPPVYCISGTDTVLTNQPVLKIDPVSLDSANIVMENGEPVDLVINDFTDVIDADYRFFDFVPGWATDYGWWILAALILIAALIFVYFKWLRHGKIPLMPVRKPIPPYELAKKRLEALRTEALWQKGAEKEYYTKLTDIMRTYIHGRFGINAMEMTSREIYEALSANEEARKVRTLAQDVMREADFVKFAQNRPDAEENEKAFRMADLFVENTKPVVPSAEDNKEKPADPADTVEKTVEKDDSISEGGDKQ